MNLGDAQMVLSYDGQDEVAYVWYSVQLDYFQRDNAWFDVVNSFTLPDYKSKEDILKIYLWNVNKSDLLISDIKVEFFEE